MRVLVVTTWLPTVGSPETGAFVQRDIEMLRQDHEVEVLHLSASSDATNVPFPVTRVPMSPSNPVSIVQAANVIADRAEAADLIHTMAPSALLPFLFHRATRPWVHTEHWSALLTTANVPLSARASLPLITRALSRPDVVIAVGHRLASAIAKHRRGPIVVIPNAVDGPERLSEPPRGDQLRLVGVGGLIPRKGPDIALRAVAELVARGVDAQLTWVGDGPMRSDLSDLAEALGISERWIPLGRIAPEAVADVISASDVFVLPTQAETFGVAVAEALVAGRPVVVGADGEQASFVAEPDGVLVAERTGSAFADGVQRVIELNSARSAVELAARSRAAFDADKRTADTAAAYAQAIGPVVAAHEPCVDVVIAAHDPSRPVERAVASALTSVSVARVLVVCHNLPAAEMAERLGALATDARVELLEHRDDVRGPAGPFNAGLARCSARFVAVMGSDDEFTPRALDAWVTRAAATKADVVIAPLRHAGGRKVPTPPTLRRRRLRGDRDRLVYRTAPLGIFSRERFGDLRFTEGVATGEDLAFTARMWFAGASVVRHRGAGEYLIHDGEGRVTFTPRPIAEELRALELLIGGTFAHTLARRDREALAVKLWRVSVFGAAALRAGQWTRADRIALAAIVRELRTFAPRAIDVLSRADASLIAALGDPQVADDVVDARSTARRRFISVRALVPTRLSALLTRHAPLRFSFASWWTLRF